MNSETSTSINKLEDIVARKKELKEQIQHQKNIISTTSQNLFEPATFFISIFQRITKNIKIFDNVLLGYSVLNSVRKLFRKK